MNNDSTYLKSLFQINPEITFLNHGSYGACPKPVFEDYQKWQIKLERDPVKFLTNDVYEQLEISRNELSKYINCDRRLVCCEAEGSGGGGYVMRRRVRCVEKDTSCETICVMRRKVR